MENKSELITLIDSIVESKSFSLEALDNIKKLRDKAERDAAELVRVKEDLTATRRKLLEADDELKVLRAASREVAAERDRQTIALHASALVKQELDLTREFKGEMKEILMAAFKNPVVRSTMYGTVPVAGSQFGSTPQPVSLFQTAETE